jgi:hypothetical protein
MGGESLGKFWIACEILWRIHNLLVSSRLHLSLLARETLTLYFRNRSQVEINTAIICASVPSIQPLIKHIFSKLFPIKRSRNPYHYYGGRNSLPLPIAEIDRSVHRDSISILEVPAPTHCSSKSQDYDDTQANVIIVHTTEEEEIKARIRAFSGPLSVYSPPASPSSAYSRTEWPMHSNTLLTGD